MLVRVVDATAVSAVLFAEPAADHIVSKLENSVVLAPTVLESHLCEICMQKLHDRETDTRTADDGFKERYLEALSLMQVMELYYIKQDPAEIVRFAVERNITVNEAYYQRLVYAFDAELVSLNEATINAATVQSLSA